MYSGNSFDCKQFLFDQLCNYENKNSIAFKNDKRYEKSWEFFFSSEI